MPRENVAVCTAPDFDPATCYGKHAFAHLCDPQYGDGCGGWEIHALEGDRAVRERVLRALALHDPKLFFGVGHGSEDTFTGQNLERLFWVCNCRELAGRVVYLLSCLTGAKLGPDMVAKGALAYVGYDREYMFVAMFPPMCRDPITEDRYAYAFFDPPLVFLATLIKGGTVGDAFKAMIDRYNYWMDLWSRSGEEGAEHVVFFLKWDRDHAVVYGDQSAVAGRYVPTARPAIPGAALVGAVMGYALTNTIEGAVVGFMLGAALDRVRRSRA